VSEDDDVIRRAKSGDADAWRALYRAHAGRLVVWLSVRPSGDSALSAEDLAADTWLTAADRIHVFHGSSEEFAGWLFGIARKLNANARRRSGRRGTQPADLSGTHAFEHAVEGPEDDLAGHDWVMRLLEALPQREREVVGCMDVVGLDVVGTSRALGMTPVAVRVARHRALRRLRRLVPDPGAELVP
jgi:RNA polymerase sigma-70 factor, ECF subfamily